MARRKVTTTTVEDDQKPPEELELEESIQSLGPDISDTHVYRYSGGKAAFLASWTRAALTMEALRDEYGAGSYVIRGRQGGKYVKGASKIVHIAELGRSGQAPVTAPVDSSAKVMEMVQLQSQRMHEMVIAMLSAKGNGGSSFDPAATMTAMIGAVTALKAATEPAGNRTQELKELLEIAELLKGGGSDDTPMGLLKSVLPALMMSKGGRRPAELPPPPGDEESESTPGAETPPPTRPGLSMKARLLSAAPTRDPAIWADLVLESADGERQPESIAIVASVARAGGDVQAWLKAQEWIPAEQHEWFSEFFAAMTEVLNNAGVVDTAGSGGDAGDAEPHGEAKPARAS